MDPQWARRASLTAEVVMVSGLKPETSMVSWREAGEPMRVSGGGGGRTPPAKGPSRLGLGAGASMGLIEGRGLG